MGKLMIIEPIRPDHLERINPRQFEADEMSHLTELMKLIPYLPNVFAGVENGEVVAIAGVVVSWPGVAEGFMITSSLVQEHPKSFHAAILRGIEVLRERQGLWRIQIAVRVGHPTGHRWICRLGFQPEGTMRKFGPDGSDYIRYARVWGGD